MQMTTKAAIDLIKEFEGFKGEPYKCPAGVPTIGYGTTIYPDGRKVSMRDDDITEAEATEYLQHEVDKIRIGLNARLSSLQLNTNQICALISWVYNLGFGNFDKSTMYKMLREKNYTKAVKSLQEWNKGGGVVLAGLVRRRKAEAELFNKPVKG